MLVAMPPMPPKRVRLSGSTYKKLRKKRKMEDEKLAGSLETFIVKTKKSETCALNEGPVSEFEDTEEEEFRSSHESEPITEGKETSVQEAEEGKEEANCEGRAGLECIQRRDFGLIPFGHLTSDVRDAIVFTGAENFQNSKGPFVTGSKGRKMTEAWFYRKLADGKGEVVKRTWLLYSLFKETAYCFCCILFSHTPQNAISKFELPEGFNGGGKWKDSTPIAVHESTTWHRKAFLAWKEAEEHLREEKGIDKEFVRHVNAEREKGRQILLQIIPCIRFLASRNLAFQGNTDYIGAVETADRKREGNFMALIRFIADFVPVLKEHLNKHRWG